MSNYTVQNGFWYDHSHSPVLGCTLTLPMKWGNRLVAALAMIVTMSASCFWIIVAFLIHQIIIQGRGSTVIGLQHSVIMRSSGSPLGTLWELTKVWLAWRRRGKRIWLRTLALMLPAMLVWVGFLAAGIFVSDAASKSYTQIHVLAKPDVCGNWLYNTDGTANTLALGGAQILQGVMDARAYATNWYGNVSSRLGASSLFPQTKLPYSTENDTSCPVVEQLCISAGYTLKTPRLDSHTMFGINAQPENRVQFQKNVTCAVIHARDYVKVFGTVEYYYFGPESPYNYTYLHNNVLYNTTAGYMLDTYQSYAEGSDPGWTPVPELNRTDADINLFFLSQNGVRYVEPVFDPFFLANGSVWQTTSGFKLYGNTFYTQVMVCTDQYSICNPNTQTCTPPGGLNQLQNAISQIRLNNTQLATAQRLVNACAPSGTFNSVLGLGDGALLAKNVLTTVFSFGLPPNQWQLEIDRWFQTSLALMQASIVNYVAMGSQPTGAGHIQAAETIPDDPPGIRAAWVAQCHSQLIQSAGEVQSFSVLALCIVLGVALILTVLAMSLEACVAAARSRSTSNRKAARSADDKLQLLGALLRDRKAGIKWENGTFDVPVTNAKAKFERPRLEGDGLPTYGPVEMQDLTSDDESDNGA